MLDTPSPAQQKGSKLADLAVKGILIRRSFDLILTALLLEGDVSVADKPAAPLISDKDAGVSNPLANGLQRTFALSTLLRDLIYLTRVYNRTRSCS